MQQAGPIIPGKPAKGKSAPAPCSTGQSTQPAPTSRCTPLSSSTFLPCPQSQDQRASGGLAKRQAHPLPWTVMLEGSSEGPLRGPAGDGEARVGGWLGWVPQKQMLRQDSRTVYVGGEWGRAGGGVHPWGPWGHYRHIQGLPCLKRGKLASLELSPSS